MGSSSTLRVAKTYEYGLVDLQLRFWNTPIVYDDVSKIVAFYTESRSVLHVFSLEGYDQPISVKCSDSQYLDKITNLCSECSSKIGNCLKCSALAPGKLHIKCDQCFDGFETKKEGNEENVRYSCLLVCRDGFVRNDSNQCVKCDTLIDNCSKCSTKKLDKDVSSIGTLSCDSCQNGFSFRKDYPKERLDLSKVDSNIKCIRLCSGYEYPDKSNKCVPEKSKGDLIVVKTQFDKKRSEGVIQFNQEIKLRGNSEGGKFNIRFKSVDDGGDTFIELEGSEVFIQSSEGLENQLRIVPQFENGKEYNGDLVITPTNQKRIVMKSDPLTFFTGLEISIQNISFYQSDQTQNLLKTKVPTQIALTSMSGVFLLANPNVAFILLRSTMMYESYTYINIDLPANMDIMLSFFDFNILRVVPNFIAFDESKIGCQPHKKVTENEKKCMLINNGILKFFLQPLMYLIIKLVCYMVRIKSRRDVVKEASEEQRNRRRSTRFPFGPQGKSRRSSAVSHVLGNQEAKSWLQSSLNFIYREINLGFWFEVFSGMQISLLISTLINLRNSNFRFFLSGLNTIIAGVILVLYLCVSSVLVLRSYQVSLRKTMVKEKRAMKNQNLRRPSLSHSKGVENNEKDQETTKVHRRWKFLTKELKDGLKNPIAKHIVAVIFIKDFVIIFVILVFLNQPRIQISIPLTINTVILITIIMSRPFKEKLKNCFKFVDSASETLNLIIFTLLLIFKQKDEKFKYKYIGTLMVIFMIVTLTAYIILSFIDFTFGWS